MSSIHVLMTGAGAPGAPGIIRCLKQLPGLRLTVGDADAAATGRFLHPDFVQLAKGTDRGFSAFLLEICRIKKIDVILPLVTRELPALARDKKKFEELGIRVLVSSESAIRLANDKSATYCFLKEKGLPVPDFQAVHTVEAFRQAVKALGYPDREVCFKPSVSNGSRGFRILSASVDEFDLLFRHKPYQSYMRYEEACRVLSGRPFPELLVSEYLPGEEYSVDCLAQEGVARLILPRQRIRTVNGISTRGSFVKDEAIMEYCREIISRMGLHGNIGIQLKRNSAGKALLLEINPRVQGTIVAALGAGINLPLLAVKQELGLPISPSELQPDWSVRFSRYWTEAFYK